MNEVKFKLDKNDFREFLANTIVPVKAGSAVIPKINIAADANRSAVATLDVTCSVNSSNKIWLGKNNYIPADGSYVVHICPVTMVTGGKARLTYYAERLAGEGAIQTSGFTCTIYGEGSFEV